MKPYRFFWRLKGCLAAGILVLALRADAVNVSGKILDKESGESIPGAAVQVVGTTRGAAADVEGLFAIPDLPAGKSELVIFAMGYQQQRIPAELIDGQDMHLTIKLVPEALQMNEVKVEAESREEREYTPQVAHYTLQTRELAMLPQVVESDLFRSLQIVPGVLPTSDFSADLNIWGGSSDQNLVLLNGIDVYKPTHLGGLFSAFNMDAIKDVKLIKGGFGAKYGGRLSAVLDIADREGNRNQPQGKVGMSLLSSNATLEGPLPHGAWLLAGRRTYLDWATKTLKNNGVIDNDFPYYFYDLNAKVTRDFGNGDRLTPSAYFGRDVLTLSSNSNDQISLSWGNATYSMPFVHVWSHNLFSTNTVAGSFFDSDFRFETTGNSVNYRNKIRDFTFKSDYSWFANVRHTLDFGVLAKSLDVRYFIGSPSDTLVNMHRMGWQTAAYVSDDYRLTDKWTVTPGLRFERNEMGMTNDLLPRLAVKKQLNENSSVNAAWGMYSQYLQLVSAGNNLLSIFDAYIPLDRSLSPNRGQQFAISYENKLDGSMRFTTDVYYKHFRRLIEFKENYVESPDHNNQAKPLSDWFESGSGDAFGMDVFLQGEWNQNTFMVGYGLGRSERAFSAIDNGSSYPVGFDRLHNANLFVSRKMSKHGSLEARFNYGTGQPVTKAVGAYSPGIGLPGHAFVPGDWNNFRLPAYHRLDVAYRWRFEHKHWTFAPFVEVINVYNRKNVLTLNYDLSNNPPTSSETAQLPFLPSIGFTAEF